MSKQIEAASNPIPQVKTEDDFDLSRLRLSQDFGGMVGAKKLLTTVSVRKPKRQEFIRVRPEEDWRLETAVLMDKEERDETYLVAPELWPSLAGEYTPVVLVTAITRQGNVLLWPIKLPGPDGKSNSWNQSALEAASSAEKAWVCVKSNMSQGAYEVYRAEGILPDPDWPEESFQTLIKLAFKDRFIQDSTHPVLRRLRGAI